MPLTREQTKYQSTNDTVFLPTVAIDRNLGVSGNSVFSGPASFTNGLTVNSLLTIELGGGQNPNFIMRGPGEQTFRFHNTNTSGTTRVSWKMADRNNSDWSWIWYTDSLGNGTNDITLANLAGTALTISPLRNATFGGTISAPGATFTGQIQSTLANNTATGGGQVYLNGATGNRIDFNQNGVAAPAFTTRSIGTKIVLWPNVGASSTDYAIGIEGSTLWNSVDTTSASFKWYGGTTLAATLTGAGALSTTSTISASGLAGSLLTSTVGTALGTAAAGTATVPARADHVHPTTGLVLTAGGSTIAVASGSTVPLTINNEGTGNSFVVNDVASDTTPFIVNSAGQIGIGTTAPTGSLFIKASDGSANGVVSIHKYTGTSASPTESLDWPEPILSLRGFGNFTSESMLSFGYSNDATYQTGEAVWNFRLVGLANATASTSSTNLSLMGPGALVLGAGGSERMRIDTAGLVTIPGSLTVSGTLTATVTNATNATRSLALRQTDGTSLLNPVTAVATSGGRGVNLAPNTYAHGLFSEFKNTTFGVATVGANYGGLLTYASWDGTSGSTGDPSYQMFFSPVGANSTSVPFMQIRAGIDAAWGNWGLVQTVTVNTTAKTAAYQLTTADASNIVQMNGAFAFNVNNTLSVLPAGTTITLVAQTTGVTVAANGSATVPTINATPGLKLRAAWSTATLIKMSAASASGSASTWLLTGDLIA